MPDFITPEGKQKLESLCEKLQVENADQDVHREILSHLEEKLAGYLSGEEKLTEEDALLLVERHFGDLPRLRDDLGKVHGDNQRWAYRLIFPLVVVSVCQMASQVALLAFEYQRGAATIEPFRFVFESLALSIAILAMLLPVRAFKKKPLGVMADSTTRKAMIAGGALLFILFTAEAVGLHRLARPVAITTILTEGVFWLLLVDRGRGNSARVAATTLVWFAFQFCSLWPIYELADAQIFRNCTAWISTMVLGTSLVYFIAARSMRWVWHFAFPSAAG